MDDYSCEKFLVLFCISKMVALTLACEADAESRHGADLETVIVHDNRIYTAADDGKVKVWNTDLKLEKEFQAHDYAVYHLLVLKNRLFTASIDATIKVWKLGSFELETTLTGHEEPVRRLATNGERLFSGDEKGDVIIWNSDSLASENRYETVEEVWDIAAIDRYFFTVRDRGLSVTEVKNDTTSMFTVVKSLQGRAPIYMSPKHLLYGEFGTGYGLHLHKNEPNDFPKITDLRGHSMIVTCVGGNIVGGSERVASSGYDNKVNLWELPSGKLLTSADVSVTPSSLAMASDGTVYFGGPDGYLAKLVAA
ncbi:WD40 repeat [Trinorchestia longiramus]|nr:WD40 repeat [Trinorchestia longiramus]